MAARMLWMFFLPAACSLHVEVNSENLVYQVGEKLNLTCSLVDCSEDPSVSWSILGDAPLGAESQSHISPTVTRLVISNVTLAHEARFLCKASCGMQKRQKATSVKVYSFPDNPVVSGNNRLLPGVKNDLTCRVSDVYPAQGLRIEWIQGGGVLKTDDGEWSAKLQGVSSVYSLPPENNGENFTCRATLNVTKDRHIMKETTVALTVLRSSTSPPETPDLKKVIIPTVGTGSLLAVAAVLIRYLRKSKGADAYSLTTNALPAV
ncbi:vascular cell adhesion protein 1-like isoform X2 [Megalops cyprinoides]|nr:vascular cell adhesion protein 1-like isoform X2 [Megalops cyprinoides]